MNDKLKYIVTSIFLSSLFAVLYTGCKQDSIEINALPFQENEGDNWGLISTSGKIEIPSGSFTRQPSAVVNGMFSLPDEKGYYQLYELKHPTHPTSARHLRKSDISLKTSHWHRSFQTPLSSLSTGKDKVSTISE